MNRYFTFHLPGWLGPNCNYRCPDGRYGADCSLSCQCRNGSPCDHITGQCVCTAGFTGTFCQQRKYGIHPPQAEIFDTCILYLIHVFYKAEIL